MQTEKEWEKLIHTEGLVIVDIYCAWCFSAITIITNADIMVKDSKYKGAGPAPPWMLILGDFAYLSR